MAPPKLVPENTLFFLCDIQTKFRPAICGYDQVVATANKLIKVAKATPLSNERAALGPVDPDIDLPLLGDLLIANFDKTLFSMLTADVRAILDARPNINSIVLLGIEAHVCVLQTVLSLMGQQQYAVHVVADGVSSCNAFEVPIAVQRMRQEGAIIGTSESIAFQLVGDASSPQFKAFSKLVKEDKESTKQVGGVLLSGLPSPHQMLSEGAGSPGGGPLKSAM